MDVINVIRRIAVALQQALDGYLAVAGPLPTGLAQAIVENEFHARAVHRLPVARAVEKYILHGFPAQMLGGRFPQHPAYCINNVRLAATVGANNADELSGHRYMRRIDKRLESSELDFSKAQFFLLCRVIIGRKFRRSF